MLQSVLVSGCSKGEPQFYICSLITKSFWARKGGVVASLLPLDDRSVKFFSHEHDAYFCCFVVRITNVLFHALSLFWDGLGGLGDEGPYAEIHTLLYNGRYIDRLEWTQRLFS